MSPGQTIERRRILYSGMVQGVGFRYTTLRVAQAYEVSGYVRNLRDGRVELVAEAAATELDSFLQDMDSTMSGYIMGTEVETEPPTGELVGFDIREPGLLGKPGWSWSAVSRARATRDAPNAASSGRWDGKRGLLGKPGWSFSKSSDRRRTRRNRRPSRT